MVILVMNMRKLLAMLLVLEVMALTALAIDTLDVYFIDVGAGDAILVDFGGWEALLDAGRGYATTSASVLDALREHVEDGIIELAILGHPHADHYGGFGDVLETYEILEFWRSKDTEPDTRGPTYAKFEQALRDAKLRLNVMECGERRYTRGLEWTVLGPDVLDTHSSNDNENSLVLLLTYGKTHFLFVGDIECGGEATAQNHALPNEHLVLKVAHHGSASSTSEAFLDWANPQYAVISTSYEDPPACSTLIARGIPDYMTSTHGTIRISSDGVRFEITGAR